MKEAIFILAACALLGCTGSTVESTPPREFKSLDDFKRSAHRLSVTDPSTRVQELLGGPSIQSDGSWLYARTNHFDEVTVTVKIHRDKVSEITLDKRINPAYWLHCN